MGRRRAPTKGRWEVTPRQRIERLRNALPTLFGNLRDDATTILALLDECERVMRLHANLGFSGAQEWLSMLETESKP